MTDISAADKASNKHGDAPINDDSKRVRQPGSDALSAAGPGDGDSQSNATANKEGSLKSQTRSIKLPLFALLIGIDDYSHAGSEVERFPSLTGAVADAHDMCDFLEGIRADPGRITVLLNEQATRANILKELSRFASNADIGIGNPIVIYFAGHGARFPAPKSWKLSEGSSDASQTKAYIEMIIPYDFSGTPTSPPPPTTTTGVLDITMAKYLSEIYEKKGNNITVIFDSCHSGSGTRGEDGVREIDLPNYKLPEGLNLPELEGVRGSGVASGYSFYGAESHVLLAACSRDGLARELGRRGVFTEALLKLLRGVNEWYRLTYNDVIQKLDPEKNFKNQDPQCEGKNIHRCLFEHEINSGRVRFPVKVTKTVGHGWKVTLDAGEVHGVAIGDEIGIFSPAALVKPLLSLVVKTVDALTADLGTVEQEIPQSAWARQLTVAKKVLVAMPSGCQQLIDGVKDAVEKAKLPIEFVALGQPCDLELQTVGDKVHFFITHGRGLNFDIPNSHASLKLFDETLITDTMSISSLLSAVVHFFSHLHRSNAMDTSPLTLHALEVQAKRDQLMTEFIPLTGDSLIGLDRMLRVHVTEDGKKLYGFRLWNKASLNFYVWAFLFDVADLAITTLYQPGKSLSPSSADPSLLAPNMDRNNTLEICYASGGVPRDFFLRAGADADVSYLKIFLTTQNVDLSHIAMKGFGCRSSADGKVIQVPLWASIVLPILLFRA